MKHFRILLLALFVFKGASALGQELNKNQIHELTEKIIETIDENYIIPSLKTKLNTALRANLKSGKYDQITLKSDFEETITKDLKALSDDHHLYLVTNEETASSKKNPRRQMMRSMPDASAFKDLLTYKMLDGNIAYLEVPMFGPLEYLKEDIDKYLEMSKSADALIIDVRPCPGGSGQTTAYLSGGFIEEPAHLTTYYSQQGEMEAFTARTDYGAFNKDKNVYVLTGPNTGSAAEGFAFYLQQMGRVQVVGMQSSGAGRSNQFFPIGADFSLSVSIRTSVTPNGKQFQGVGVTPDVITPVKNALEQAKLQAYIDLKKDNPANASSYDNLIAKVGQPAVKLGRRDMDKIKNTVKGYIENFFENNTEQMFKYLHTDLAKRGITKKRGASEIFLQKLSNEELKDMLSSKKPLLKAEQRNEIEVLDVFHNTASVKLTTGYPGRMEWIEYILLCREGNDWKILDIVWDYFPPKSKKKRG